MKVVILSFSFAEFCIQQANGLARECDVLLMLHGRDTQEFRSRLNPKVKLVEFDTGRLRQPLRQIMSTAALLRQLRQFQPDVLHVQHGHMWFNLALPLLRNLPLVVTIHDPRHHAGDRVSRKTPQSIMDFGFRRADRAIVHGQSIKQQVIDLLGISAGRIHVIPLVAIGNVGEPPEPCDDGRTVLFFGRIWKYKGLEYLIQAAPIVAQMIPDVRFVIAGQGDEFEPYRRMMHEPRQFVVHNRHVSAAERDELFRQSSIVVLPYIEATQSGVVPVAYSYAKPVVATDTGALREAVDDGVTGHLVPPSDPTALAKAIIELLADPARCRAMGAAGRRKLDGECSPDVVARQTLEVYCLAIRDHKSVLPKAARAGKLASTIEDSLT